MAHNETWLAAMRSDEHRAKQRENSLRLGNKPPVQWGNKVNLGRKLTDDHKRKISKALKGRKGHPWSEDDKKKLSKALKGRIPTFKGKHHTEESKLKIGSISRGKPSWMKGKHHSEKTKMEMSKIKKDLFKHPENHPRWNGGITPENAKIRNGIEFRLWRESVFAFDNWTCQKCKVKGENLHPHHVQNFSQFPDLRFAIDNGITFCRECHIKFHTVYGRKDNNRDQIEEFIQVTGV